MSDTISDRPDAYQGYSGPARRALVEHGITVWSKAEVINDRGSVFTGVVLPRSETFDDLHVVLKLANGYNIGIRYGDFYARRLIDDLGLSPQNGVVRVSLVHYNTLEEVDRLIGVLDSIL